MAAIRFEAKVGQERMIQLPGLEAGDQVEVIVLKLRPAKKPIRKGGWIKGKIVILTDFDDPIPGMEDYF